MFREFAADPALVCLSGPQVYDDVPRSTRLLSQMFFGLPIFASGRRLSVEGVLLTGLRYSLNYLWIMLFQRPFTLVSRDIRPVL